MQLRRIVADNNTMAVSFVIAGATIFCWTTAMGAAAANGAGQALLDGITVAAVVALGCIGGMGMVRSKKHGAAAQQPQTAEQASALLQEKVQPEFPTASTCHAESFATIAPAAGSDANVCPQSATERACRALAQAHDLSLRERDVLDLMATGMTGKEIATELTLSYNTVKSHIRHIYTKLDVHRKQDLADLIDQQQQLFERQRVA